MDDEVNMRRTGWKLWGVLFAGFVVLLVASWFYLKNRFDMDKTPESFRYVAKFEKEGVPAFRLKTVKGAEFDFASVKAPVVIINFWASWCDPCVQEFASMLKLFDQLGGNVVVVAVSMDDDPKDLENFLKLFKVPRPGFEVVWDKDKKIGEMYGVGKLPESFIVGPDRRLVRKVIGIEDWATPQAVSYFGGLAEMGSK